MGEGVGGSTKDKKVYVDSHVFCLHLLFHTLEFQRDKFYDFFFCTKKKRMQIVLTDLQHIKIY
jgi:hypothetical protein